MGSKIKGSLLLLSLLSLLVSACGSIKKADHDAQTASVDKVALTPKPLVSYLLEHSLSFNSMGPEQRRAECKRISALLKQESVAFSQVELAMFIGIEPSCGSVDEAIKLIEVTLKNQKLERDFLQFAQYQLVLLQQMQELRNREQRLRRQLKSSAAKQEALEQKLKALQSIEESINQRIEVQPNE